MSQQHEALALANQVRIDGAHIRHELTAGLVTLEAGLHDTRAQFMPVGRLICTQRGWGPSKTHHLLGRLNIWPTRRVRDLTARQKAAIVEALAR
jgi:hypothetical protein